MVTSIKPGSIPGYSPTAAAGKAQADNASTNAAGGARVSTNADSFELTPQARAVAEASLQTGDMPVNTAKVQALRQQIADGSYTVDAQSIAAKLTQLDSSLGGD